jgi:hypothetical protein
MKIRVTRGEVPIRSVVVRSHLEGRLYSVTIATPLDRHPLVTLGQVITTAAGLAQRVELYRARRQAADFSPSVVELSPDRAVEEFAFDGGLSEIEWNRWEVTLIAIAPDVLGFGGVVESWEEFERGFGRTDYIEGAPR